MSRVAPTPGARCSWNKPRALISGMTHSKAVGKRNLNKKSHYIWWVSWKQWRKEMGDFKKWSTRPFCRGNLLWFLFFIMWPPNTLFPTSSLHLKKVSLFCIRTFCFKFFSPILKRLSNFHNMECYDPQVLLYTRIHLYSTSFIYRKVCSPHFHGFLRQCLQLSMSPHI